MKKPCVLKNSWDGKSKPRVLWMKRDDQDDDDDDRDDVTPMVTLYSSQDSTVPLDYVPLNKVELAPMGSW